MVMMKKTSNRWLGLLGAAVIVSAVGASSDSYYSDTSTDCSDRRIGDGYCDNRNNNELCSKCFILVAKKIKLLCTVP